MVQIAAHEVAKFDLVAHIIRVLALWRGSSVWAQIEYVGVSYII